MANWDDGYVTDVPDVTGYYHECGPVWLGRTPDDLHGLTDGVWLAMRRGGRSVMRDGAAVSDAAEAKSILHDIIGRIVRLRVPLFRDLGVL